MESKATPWLRLGRGARHAAPDGPIRDGGPASPRRPARVAPPQLGTGDPVITGSGAKLFAAERPLGRLRAGSVAGPPDQVGDVVPASVAPSGRGQRVGQLAAISAHAAAISWRRLVYVLDAFELRPATTSST